VARFIADGLIGRRAGRIAPAFSPDQIGIDLLKFGARSASRSLT
jgi:hypothetical protein